MKIVRINMDLYIPDNIGTNIDAICSYLNNMMNYEPQFFGEFDSGNIESIVEEDGSIIYKQEISTI